MNTQQQPASPTPATQQSPLLRWTLGIALPLVAGTTFWWIPALLGYADVMDDLTTGYLVLGVTVAFAIAGAAVLRSWWALLIVPLAWMVGESLIALVIVLASPTVSTDWTQFFPQTRSIMMLVGLPLVISAGLGVLLGQWLTRRGTKHGISQSPLGT